MDLVFVPAINPLRSTIEIVPDAYDIYRKGKYIGGISKTKAISYRPGWWLTIYGKIPGYGNSIWHSLFFSGSDRVAAIDHLLELAEKVNDSN